MGGCHSQSGNPVSGIPSGVAMGLRLGMSSKLKLLLVPATRGCNLKDSCRRWTKSLNLLAGLSGVKNGIGGF